MRWRAILCLQLVGEVVDQNPGMGVIVRLKIGERWFAGFAVALVLEKKDRQGPEQAEIASRYRGPDHTTVFILGAVAPMVLPILNAPVIPSQLQQGLGAGLLRGEGGHRKNSIVRFFVDLALAHILGVAVEANDLGYAR